MGSVFRPRMPNGKLSPHWYCRWQVGGKTRKRRIGPRRAATAALARFEEAEARRKFGLSDPGAEARDRARPLDGLLAEYLDVLAARGLDGTYRANTGAMLARALAGCPWYVWSDVTADSLLKFLGRLRDRPAPRALRGAARAPGGPARSGSAPARGAGAATLNSYLRTAKAFARWAAARFGAPSPLARMKPFPEEVDVRRSRRTLTDAELGALLAATAAAPRRSAAAVWGADRAMLYRVAAFTGLRAGELATLTPAHFDLGARPPVVTVPAQDSKGKRAEPVPLPDHLAALLRAWLAGRAPAARVWPGNWAAFRAQTSWLRADLARAGIDPRDAEGRPVTFHSLKRAYVGRLIRAGAAVHEVRRLARHTDVKTTLKHYTNTDLAGLGALANKLPPV